MFVRVPPPPSPRLPSSSPAGVFRKNVNTGFARRTGCFSSFGRQFFDDDEKICWSSLLLLREFRRSTTPSFCPVRFNSANDRLVYDRVSCGFQFRTESFTVDVSPSVCALRAAPSFQNPCSGGEERRRVRGALRNEVKPGVMRRMWDGSLARRRREREEKKKKKRGARRKKTPVMTSLTRRRNG